MARSPWSSLSRLFRRKRTRPWDLNSLAETFEAIHRENTWKSAESVSGSGSTLAETEALRRELPGLFAELGVHSLLDIPCGDFRWMQALDLDLESYVGADIVEALAVENQRRFGDARRRFEKLDLTRDPLPAADLILCRDCLVHLSFTDAGLAVKNLLHGEASYFAATTFPDCRRNDDARTGHWRPLNLQRPPFDFPEPLDLIYEGCRLKGHADF